MTGVADATRAHTKINQIRDEQFKRVEQQIMNRLDKMAEEQKGSIREMGSAQRLMKKL
jgi:hypothetical protein